MQQEYKDIKQITDELNYLKEEHQAEFQLILSKRISTIADDASDRDWETSL